MGEIVSFDDLKVTSMDDGKLDALITEKVGGENAEEKPVEKQEEKQTENAGENKDSKPENKDTINDNSSEKDEYEGMSKEDIVKKLKELEHINKAKMKQVNDRGNYIDKLKLDLKSAQDQAATMEKQIQEINKKYQEQKEDADGDVEKIAEAKVRSENDKKIAEERLMEARMKEQALNLEYAVKSFEPDFEQYIDAMAEVAKEKWPQLTAEHINNFKARPFDEKPDLLMGLLYAAKDKKYRKMLEEKEQEIVKAKENVVSKITNAAKSRPITSSFTKTGNISDNISNAQISSIKDDELEKMIAEGNELQ